MEFNEKNYKLIISIDIIKADIRRFEKLYPVFHYFNKESEVNIEKKLIILDKMIKGESLTEEEKYDRTVFELLPDIDFTKYKLNI